MSSNPVSSKTLSNLFRSASTPIIGYINKGIYFIDLKAIPEDQTNIVSQIIKEVLL